MPLADAVSIAKWTSYDTEVAHTFTPRAGHAERHARREIGDDLYDTIEADATHDAYDLLEEAESLLTVYYALGQSNLSVGEDGAVTRVQGWDQSRRENMSYRELQAYREEEFLGQAEDILDQIQADEETATEDVPNFHI